MNNNLTDFQQMLFMTISRDHPFMPMLWKPGTKEHSLILEIQELFDNIEGQPLNTYDASYNTFWKSSLDDSGEAIILAERVTEDESCLIILDIVNGNDVFTKYLINMKTNDIKHWDGLPWSEIHAAEYKALHKSI